MHDESARHSIRNAIPARCHLWSDKPLTREALRADLAVVKEYVDDSHLIRSLMRCRRCGQLYFHEFYEVVDWVGGNDAQYSTWIPVEDEESADRLNTLSPFEILRYSAIQVDYPSDAENPGSPYRRDRSSERVDSSPK